MANKFLEAFDDEYKDMKSMKAKSNPGGMGMGKDCSGFISMLFKAKDTLRSGFVPVLSFVKTKI